MFRELPWAPQGIWEDMEGMALFINISPQELSGPQVRRMDLSLALLFPPLSLKHTF